MKEKLRKVVVVSEENKEMGEVSVSLTVPKQYRCLAVIAHGAGGDMDNKLLVDVQEGLANRSIATVRFNFLYSETGNRAPDRRAQLLDCWRSIADWARNELEPEELRLAGKSMGGRMASYLVAEGYRCNGLFFLGYPLHPLGKTDQLRTDHLPSIRVPMLFLSGTRDALCKLDLLKPVVEELGALATLHIIEGGDHSLKTPKKLGRSESEVTGEVLDSVTRWIESVG